MATSSARKETSTAGRRTGAATSRTDAAPLIIYTASSLDGTSFTLDPESQHRIRAAIPHAEISTRHVFVAHDTRESIGESIRRFEEQIVALLTGLSAERLTRQFTVSFRDPLSERELQRLAAKSTA